MGNLTKILRGCGVLLAGLSLLVAAGPAAAYDFAEGKVQLHGFLTQGAVFTSDNNFLGRSESGSLDFREIGVNLSVRPHPDLQVSGQLLSHKAGKSDGGEVRVDYALADWTALSGEALRGGVRVGRVKTPYGLYNLTRDVAFTRPSIVLPQSIYLERTRNLTMAADGVEFYLDHDRDSGHTELNLAIGKSDVGGRVMEATVLGRERAGDLEARVSHIVRALYEGANGRYRLGFTSAFSNVDYQPGPADPLLAGHVDFDPMIFSAQYNAEHWSLTGEYALRKTRLTGFGPLLRFDATGESYYLQGLYRPAPQWELMLRYDAMVVDRDDRDGKSYAAATGQPAFSRYARDWTVGARYDVNSSFMVRAEYHHVVGTSWLVGAENPVSSSLERRWDMFMLLGSFRF